MPAKPNPAKASSEPVGAREGDVSTIERAAQSPDGDYPLWFSSQFTAAKHDVELRVVTEQYPKLEAWRDLAHRWLSRVAHDTLVAATRSGERKVVHPQKVVSLTVAHKVPALKVFLLEYLALRDEKGSYIHERYWANPFDLLRVDSGVRDNFWELCCIQHFTEIRNKKTGRIQKRCQVGATYSSNIKEFLDWIIESVVPRSTGSGVADLQYRCPFRARNFLGVLVEKGLSRDKDLDFSWVKEEFPSLVDWQPLASEWIKQERQSIPIKLQGLSKFLGTYLPEMLKKKGEEGAKIAAEPSKFLRRGSGVENDLGSVFTAGTVAQHDYVVAFIDWVLLHKYSDSADDGTYIVSPAFRNPFKKIGRTNASGTGTSVWSPLPYGYIERLRLMLVEGHTFRDWKWAQQAMTSEERGGRAVDWFPVRLEQIDMNDPDCVWRRRDARDSNGDASAGYEMWSPVRWIALLCKLIVPARTVQVRVLDSGEADTWKWDGRRTAGAPNLSAWVPNPDNPNLCRAVADKMLASVPASKLSVKPRRPIAIAEYSAGVLQRVMEWQQPVDPKTGRKTPSQVEVTKLYFNTNKTADSKKEGSAKGFSVAWPVSPWPVNAANEPPTFAAPHDRRRWLVDCSKNIHYWISKLRDWQTKYNPVSRLTSWQELMDNGIIEAKSDEQMTRHRDGVFLFRDPAYFGVHGKGTRDTVSKAHLPITNSIFNRAWWVLLKELQRRLAIEGQANQDGTPIRLIDRDDGETATTLFPPHSIRVSLITALVLDGGVSLPLVMSLVGHSRLIMTLYYTKPDSLQQLEALKAAQTRLDQNAAESVYRFLRNASIEQLREQAVYNDAESAFAAIGLEVKDRNPAGWLEMLNGLCPVGGNTTPNPENRMISGCFNGGPLIKDDPNPKNRRYAPVEGGARNCPNCRWFVTRPYFLSALVATWNNTEYHRCEAVTVARAVEKELNALSDEIYDQEQLGAIDSQLATLYQARTTLERRLEGAIKKVQDLATTMINLDRLINRCIEVANNVHPDDSSTDSLVLNGGASEWHAMVDGTDSELLQLCGIAADAEIYPDLDAGKAIIRRSQILDAKLLRDGVSPMFLTLSEDLQLKIGNEFMRQLAAVCDPANPRVGQRRVVEIIDSSQSLSGALLLHKKDLGRLLESARSVGPRLPAFAPPSIKG